MDAAPDQRRLSFAAHAGLWAGWDSLAAGAPMVGSPPWMRMRAPRVDGETWTFVVSRGEDVVGGMFATVAAEGFPDDAFDLREVLAGRARTTPPSPLPPPSPTFVTQSTVEVDCVTKVGYPHLSVAYPGYECFVAGPGRDDAGVVAELVRGIVDWAAARGLVAVGFLYTIPDDAILAGALEAEGFAHTPFTAVSDMHLVGDSFADYLASLPRHHRAEVRRERRRLAAAGMASGPVDVVADIDEIVGLRLQHAVRYGRKVSEEKERSRIHVLLDGFGAGNVLGFGVRDADGALVTFCVVVEWLGEWYLLESGTDYGHPEHRFTYFEAGYYAPVEAAYERGVRVLHYGMGSWDAKRYRGCTLVGRDVWWRELDA